jgi:4'-phosphopantetheinyl transferase EntD
MNLIAQLLPEVVVCVEARDDADVDLFPEEATVVARAVPKRRREFTTGRACARLALGRLGLPESAVGSGAHGEPLWPRGVVGSLTHCTGFTACAVARSDALTALGIDAEPDAPLPEGVREDVLHGREREEVASGAWRDVVHLDRLVFSAKEAVYKAWFPLAGRRLGFEDVELDVRLDGGFSAAVLVPGPAAEFRGRWVAANGLVCTAVVMP